MRLDADAQRQEHRDAIWREDSGLAVHGVQVLIAGKSRFMMAQSVGCETVLFDQSPDSSRAVRSAARRSRAIGSTRFIGGSSLSSQSLPSACRRRSLRLAMLTACSRWIRTNPNGTNRGATSPIGLTSTRGVRERRRTSVSPPLAFRKYTSSGSSTRCSLREKGREFDAAPYRLCSTIWSPCARIGGEPHRLVDWRMSRFSSVVLQIPSGVRRA
jgi:hypothetical protein